jgi:hypothetical protein
MPTAAVSSSSRCEPKSDTIDHSIAFVSNTLHRPQLRGLVAGAPGSKAPSVSDCVNWPLLREGDEGYVPRPLDCHCERPLVLCAGSRLPPWLDLATIGNMASQTTNVLVIDIDDLVHTKGADLASRVVTATTTAAAPTLSMLQDIHKLGYHAKTGRRRSLLRCCDRNPGYARALVIHATLAHDNFQSLPRPVVSI